MAQGFPDTLEAGLTDHSNRHHNLWMQCLNCDLEASQAGALDLLPLKDTEPFICPSPSSFTVFSTFLFFMCYHLTSPKFVFSKTFFSRREHKTFTSSLTSVSPKFLGLKLA